MEPGDGPPTQPNGVVFDITAHKQAGLELERRGEELQTMLDLIPVGVAVAHDPQAQRIAISPRLAAMLRVPIPPGAGAGREGGALGGDPAGDGYDGRADRARSAQ